MALSDPANLPPSPSTKKKPSPKIQLSSTFSREPGGSYHETVHFNDTGKTKTFASKDAHEQSSATTITKNPATVSTNGDTKSWNQWAESKSNTIKIPSPKDDLAGSGFDASEL